MTESVGYFLLPSLNHKRKRQLASLKVGRTQMQPAKRCASQPKRQIIMLLEIVQNSLNQETKEGKWEMRLGPG